MASPDTVKADDALDTVPRAMAVGTTTPVYLVPTYDVTALDSITAKRPRDVARTTHGPACMPAGMYAGIQPAAESARLSQSIFLAEGDRSRAAHVREELRNASMNK
jgi:hypothetical protein